MSKKKDVAMYQQIHDVLYRQQQALGLLVTLLEEEYELLRTRQTQAVVSLEFSIHELIRQLALEKSLVIQLLDGLKLREYIAVLPQEQGDALYGIFKNIDSGEQRASRQASRNAELSLALLDQSKRLTCHLHEQIQPKIDQMYSKHGELHGYAGGARRPQAALISGRL